MNKEFQREVLTARPNWLVTDDYFYVSPADHILCGFLYEDVGGGAYIWRYAFPLYDHVDFISLAFGERLPKGFIRPKGRSQRELAHEFINHIEPYEAATFAWQDLRNFLTHVESLTTLGNPLEFPVFRGEGN